MNILYIILGLILLVVGGNWLLKSSVGLSLKLNISKIIVGLTVVSFATSAPEMIVSIKAALEGFPDIAVGNVVGSNIGNVGLVLGVVLLINAIQVETNFYKTDWPMKMIASVLLFFFLMLDGKLSRIEGIIFVVLLIAFIVHLIKQNKKIDIELKDEGETEMPYAKIFGLLAIGGFALWLGSELLVEGAVNLAEGLGVSKRVIAITVVSIGTSVPELASSIIAAIKKENDISIGTSVPELASSIIAAIKKENDISIGNIIGSNIFNILSVLGFTAIIKPIENVDTKIMSFDIYWLLAFAFILLPMVFLPKRNSLSFREGIILVTAYMVFIYFTIQ